MAAGTTVTMASYLATKSIEHLMRESDDQGEHGLRRALGPVNLVTLGIGAIIGAGIFVITGSAAAQFAGPAIVLSFLLAGVGCVFAGLCYAEFASLIPIAGSAYTYAYATLGEFFAWVIGWDLIIEYAFGAATVASGWSGNVVSLLQDLGWHLPPQLTATPGTPLVLVGDRWEIRASVAPVERAAVTYSLCRSTSATTRMMREPLNSAPIATTSRTVLSPGPNAATNVSSSGSCGNAVHASLLRWIR